MYGVDISHFTGTPKPSFGSALSQVKSYVFDLVSNGKMMEGDVQFIDAYIHKELKEWCSKTMPDATFGTDYRYPMCSHLTIIATYSHSTKLTWNGVWQWEVKNFRLEFKFGETDTYKYYFNLPNMKINGGDFENPELFNMLLEKVDRYKYRYNSSASIKLPKYNTMWTENNLKNYYNQSPTIIEGIYESTNSSKGNSENKYKLAVKEFHTDTGSEYALIYLNGANLYDDWSEGEIKCFLIHTAKPDVYKGTWIMLDKSKNNNCYIRFVQDYMQIVVDGEIENYIKLFPTDSDLVPRINSQWSGTGFALKNGYVVTNYHVIDGAKSIKINGVNGNFNTSYNTTVVGSDKINDLALLKISDSSFTGFGSIPYSISSNTSDVGEEIFVLGYPLTSTMGEEIKLTTGIISSKTGFQGDVALYQISAPIQPGNSGGPLFDKKGNVIGIVSAKHEGAENVGYAIKTIYLRNLIESCASPSIIPSTNSVSALPLTSKVKSEKNFVFFIHCTR